jgi:hypothetical protein
MLLQECIARWATHRDYGPETQNAILGSFPAPVSHHFNYPYPRGAIKNKPPVGESASQ